MTTSNNREHLIDNSNFCSTYKEFLKRFPEEPIPGTPQWNSNINYMTWINEKHREFKQLNGYPPNFISKAYLDSFEKWLLDKSH
jgi:hypothetical protein